MTAATDKCFETGHWPTLEITTFADGTSVWLCDCGKVRYEIPRCNVAARCEETTLIGKHRCSLNADHDGPHIADLGNVVCGWPNP